VELLDGTGEAGRVLYRRFLDELSGVARIRTSAEEGRVLVFDVALENGCALAAINMASDRQCVHIPGHAGYPAILAELGAGRTLFVQLDHEGQVIAAAAQGVLEVDGAAVLGTGGDCAFLALDGQDLRWSAQVLVLPFGAGPFALARLPGDTALVGEVGEFRAGKWTKLEPQALVSASTCVSGLSDDATAYDLRLLAKDGEQAMARERAEKLLRVRR
jgi:hypothetical protein